MIHVGIAKTAIKAKMKLKGSDSSILDNSQQIVSKQQEEGD